MRGQYQLRESIRLHLRSVAILFCAAWPCASSAAPLPSTPGRALHALEAAWQARDADAYLALWRFADDAARDAERNFLAAQWSGDEALLDAAAPLPDARRSDRMTAYAELFAVTEPRGRISQLLYTLARADDGWAVVGRDEVGQIDGLVHLTLAPEGFRAAGLTVRLEDFEMTWTSGTVFTSPASVGPTVLVFVGDGTVRFRPTPATEREQVRQYTGRPELVERVRSAFMRIHPADFHRVVSPGRLERDPDSASRLPAAERLYREQVGEAFQLDTNLPRAPWWMLPGLGDALVAFPARRATLTYAVSGTDHEGVSLFDRKKRQTIALYPGKGKDTSYDEDDDRNADVRHHDLSVRLEPARAFIGGENRMRIRLRSPSPTVRLRLDESLQIESIQSPQGGDHLFFRVRNQDAIMVGLGALSGRVGEITLTVRFSGFHRPAAVEREVLQQSNDSVFGDGAAEIPVEPVLVYSNRTAWYPQGATDDYATAVVRINLPAGDMAVTGGTPGEARTEGGRTVVEYRQDLPGKYITVAAGRLVPVDAPGVTRLRGHSVPRARAQAPAILAEASEMLGFFEAEFGALPYPVLNLVLMEGRTPGGHAPPGMVVLSQRPPLVRHALRDDPASFWDVPGFFLAHELAHQWWGHGVAARNYHERWISEAMAHYAAALWVRHKRGEEEFRRVMARMERWALRHSAQGPLQLGHRLGHLRGDSQIYRAIVYDKGAWVLHMLRRDVGEDAFRRALATVQRDHRFGKAGAAELRRALEAESGRDLAAFFAQWVEGTAIPELTVTRRTRGVGGQWETDVTVRGANVPPKTPLEVAVVHASGREAERVSLPAGGGTFTIATSGRPRRIEVNADAGLLARVKLPGGG